MNLKLSLNEKNSSNSSNEQKNSSIEKQIVQMRKKIAQMKNKKNLISNKIVKKHKNSSNVIYSYSRRDFTRPLMCLLPQACGPLRPPPLITSADYNSLICAIGNMWK